MNIAIIGVGGVGGYFGAKVCNAMTTAGANVYFVARGLHLETIKRKGLTVRTSSEGVMSCQPTLATDSIEELPPLDACLLCVKSFDLQDVTRRLRAKVSGGTEIVPLLNGVDIYERIRETISGAVIFPACVFVGTHISEPGVISQDGGACRILYGKSQRDAIANPAIIPDIFRRSAIKHEWHGDIAPSIWTKYIFIASFGLVTACFNKTLDQVMDSAELKALVRSVMSEITGLATAQGIHLPSTVIEDSLNKAKEFPPGTKTSFQRDYELRNKPDERDIFGGTIIRLGKQLNVPTPDTQKIYAMIS